MREKVEKNTLTKSARRTRNARGGGAEKVLHIGGVDARNTENGRKELALKLVTQPPSVKISASASPELMVSFLRPASSVTKYHGERRRQTTPPPSEVKKRRRDGSKGENKQDDGGWGRGGGRHG